MNSLREADIYPIKFRSSIIRTVEERFWQRVIKAEGCWGWTCKPASTGYGMLGVRINGKWESIGAHRISWMIANGDIPEGLQILHHCDNRICSNPEHLYAGTPRDNTRDMYSRGRNRSVLLADYTKHPNAKLTWDDVTRIREMSATHRVAAIAREFGISWKSTNRVVKHIAFPESRRPQKDLSCPG